MRPRPTVCADGAYAIEDGGLPVGSTLGGKHFCVKLLANGSIDEVHSIEAGSALVRDVDVHHYDGETSLRLTRGLGRFTLRPECQVQRYSLACGVEVEKTTFVLAGSEDACYIALQLRNVSERTACVESMLVGRLKRSFGDRIEVDWDRQAHAMVVRSPHDGVARAIRCSVPAKSWSVTGDHARVLANQWDGPFDETIDTATIDPLGVIHVETRLAPQATAKLYFAVIALPHSSDGRAVSMPSLPRAERALSVTREHYDGLLENSVVMTPVSEIDFGLRWAKANMVRVMHETPTGPGFTNNPGRSTACVGRDAAWFVHGCDWLDPTFSAALLRGFAARQEADGKIVEYYDLRTGATSDDGLNVNDNTPLFVLAASHHAMATGDHGFLEEIYPAVRRAVEQLLANRDGRGLVFCTADGTGAHGIVGWRNIIKDYRLSGATTELNSETYAALQRVAALAGALGRAGDEERYASEAATLRANVERHLRNGANGLYYLNLDVDGRPRSTLSSDLVFPVIFGIADDETSARIVQRLRQDDFWTAAGIRTVPRDAPEYGPLRGNGLLGGVWVAVTFWYAFAAARFVPEIMAEALQNAFAHYARDPSATNTVPGQFSEWLHGDTLANEGMMLSPWFPPRYVWAAIDGAAGLDVRADGACITPRLPPSWLWLAARNVPFQGGRLAWIVVRLEEMRIFVSGAAESPLGTERYERDVTAEIEVEGKEVAVVALRRGGEVLVFLGSRAAHTTSVALLPGGAIAGLRPRRRYESLHGSWRVLDEGPSAYVATIGPGGFALIECG